MSEGRSPWRIVLSVCITTFLVIRLMYTCSKMNNNTNDYQNNAIQNLENNEMMNEYRRIQTENRQTISNLLFYKPYKQLDSLPQENKALYSVYKLDKDTVVNLDIETKIKIPKESYFQKNYDDSLKMAFKSPDDIVVFVHDFTGKGSNEDNLKSIKRGLNLQAFKTEENKTDNTNLFSYTVTQNGTTYNGYAMGFKNDNYFLFLEFESDKVSKEGLKVRALTYLLDNLVPKK